VGRGEEGSSSNQPELAAFFLALRDTLIQAQIQMARDGHKKAQQICR